MVKKRVTRARKRELEQPDEFLTYSHQMLRFASKYKFHLSIALGVVVVFAVSLAAMLYFADKAENRAFFLLGQGLNKYQTSARSSGPEQAYRDVAADFDLIIQKYPNNVGGKLARVFFADICFKAGEYDRAIALYSASLAELGDKQFLKNMVLNSLGYAYQAIGDHARAAAYFEQLAAIAGYSMKDEALFNLAHIYKASGNTEDSLSALKKIISEHENSMYLEMVKETTPG